MDGRVSPESGGRRTLRRERRIPGRIHRCVQARYLPWLSPLGRLAERAAPVFGASNGSAKYWVSCTTSSSPNSMMLTEIEGTPS